MTLQQNLIFLQTQKLLSEHPELSYSDDGRNTRLLQKLAPRLQRAMPTKVRKEGKKVSDF